MKVKIVFEKDYKINNTTEEYSGTEAAIMALCNRSDLEIIAQAIAEHVKRNFFNVLNNAKTENADDMSSGEITLIIPAKEILTALESRPLDQMNA